MLHADAMLSDHRSAPRDTPDEFLQINSSPSAPKRCSERQCEESSCRVSIANGLELHGAEQMVTLLALRRV